MVRNVARVRVHHLEKELATAADALVNVAVERPAVQLGEAKADHRAMQHDALVVHRVLHVAAVVVDLPAEFLRQHAPAKGLPAGRCAELGKEVAHQQQPGRFRDRVVVLLRDRVVNVLRNAVARRPRQPGKLHPAPRHRGRVARQAPEAQG